MTTYEVIYECRGDRNELLETSSVGFFKTRNEIKENLKGLSPWDFNSMNGSGKFILMKHPLTFTEYDTTERDENIKNAKKHAEEHKDLWNRRWNGNFRKIVTLPNSISIVSDTLTNEDAVTNALRILEKQGVNIKNLEYKLAEVRTEFE